MNAIARTAAAAILAALAAAPAAAYDETSTSTDILDSCKSFSLSSTMVLSATCNKVTVTPPNSASGNDDSDSSDEPTVTVSTNDTSIDLDDYVWNNAGKMKFDNTGQKGGFDAGCVQEHITVYTSSIPLGARCATVAGGCAPINSHGDLSETTCTKSSLALHDLLINNTTEGKLIPKP